MKSLWKQAVKGLKARNGDGESSPRKIDPRKPSRKSVPFQTGSADNVFRSNPHGYNRNISNRRQITVSETRSQDFSAWPDDEFNDIPTDHLYIDPSENQHDAEEVVEAEEEEEIDEYDTTSEFEHSSHAIGQTEFFGHNDGGSSGCGSVVEQPSLAPPLTLQQQHTSISSQRSEPRRMASSHGIGSKPNDEQRTTLSSGSSANSSAHHHQHHRHHHHDDASELSSPLSSRNSADMDSCSPQQLPPTLPARSQPKVLGTRISEGLDTKVVIKGVRMMVSNHLNDNKNQQNKTGGNQPTSRFVPPTVTPPDSDECEPELPARISTMVVNETVGGVSPSPPSSESSHGMAPPSKKRQAPPPPPPQLRSQSVKKTEHVELPAPVPEFKIHQTPSVSSSEGGDDVVPAMLMNRNHSDLQMQRQSIQHTTSTPLAFQQHQSHLKTQFLNRFSNGSSSSSGISSGFSSSNSSTSASVQRLSVGTSPQRQVLIKVPSNRQQQQHKQQEVATSFTSNSSLTKPALPSKPVSFKATSQNAGQVQVTVVSNPPTNTIQPDDEIYSGAESVPFSLLSFDWYHGKMSRDDSEKMLRSVGKEGSFLIRDCNNMGSQPDALFTLCLFSKRSCHYIQICRRPEANNRLAVGSKKDSEKTFESLQDLVKFHMTEAPLVVQPRPGPGSDSKQFLCKLEHPIARKDMAIH